MPIFYNTLAPTPSTKNTINSVTVGTAGGGIRDFLLNLNLLPVYPFLSTSLNGSPRIGEPVLDTMVGTGNINVPIGLPLETNGILWKDLNVIMNTFQNDSPIANTLTEINMINAVPNTDFGTAYWPQGIQSYPTSATEEVGQYGLLGKTTIAEYRKDNTIKNLYLDASKQIDMADFINLQPLNISQQIGGYLDQYGALNLGGSGAIQAANVIGSVLNGQGLGLAKGGVVTNFDIRSSLAGRVLGAAGIINDTKLGMIGGQQLALALANNAAFNVQQEIFGALNVQDNILSLIKGNGFAGFRPSYKITIPSSTGGKILDTAGKILGFTIPRSYLEDDGSLFQSESGEVENIDRANAMILHTGKGQIQALLTNVRANQLGISPSGYDSPSKSKFRSGYAPAYKNNKGEVQITDGILYAFSKEGQIINLFGSDDGIIADLSYLREQKVSEAGFKSPTDLQFVGHRGGQSYDDRKISDVTFSWGTGKGGMVNTDLDDNYSEITGDKKSLLVKTQQLFNSKGMLNVVTRKGDMNKKSTQIQTANGKGFSKGNAVMTADMFDLENGIYKGEEDKTAEETYCRSWTTIDRYDTVSKMVRSHGLWDSPNLPYRFNLQGSILDEFGFPKIAPYTNDSPTDPKKFMFSIENLAWHDDVANLPTCERGPGDLLTGKRGRIMWFPPYNIQFSESNSVNWESNNFIGRGESIYTYNNTERSGSLSFQVIVDHPSYVNSFRGLNGPDDHFVASFFAGCIDPNSKWAERLTVSQRSDIVTDTITTTPKRVLTPEPDVLGLKVYFPNDNSDVNLAYENGLSGSSIADSIDYKVSLDGAGYGLSEGSVADTTQKAIKGKVLRWADRYNFGLNYSNWNDFPKEGSFKTYSVVCSPIGTIDGFYDPNRVQVMGEYLTKICPHCVVEITGYASKQGFTSTNLTLADKRANKVLTQLKKELTPIYEAAGLKADQIASRFKLKPGKENDASAGCPKQTTSFPDPPTDPFDCKKDRYVNIDMKFSADLQDKETPIPASVTTTTQRNVTNKITNKYYGECGYFDQLTDADPFVFDRFREKIRYFHPAFHSTTPEGLNARLTFLLQCTRQGKTLEEQGANNLAFGRPPVCILRIGDFYNTKIVMDSVNIDYEPLVWDLNPEGVGVQPMIANVSISFKFIGGSTLMGPLNKLQNALSFNYFANTQVYDPRADYIAKTPPAPAKVTVTDDPNKKSADGTSERYSAEVKAQRAWNLVEGQANIADPEVTEITPEMVKDNTPALDQPKNAEIAAAATSTVQEPSSTGFTVDNITAFMEFFQVGKQSWVRASFELKKDAAGQVIKPTSNFQADLYLVHAMVPKDGASYDNCAKACPSDMVAGQNTNGDFIGSVLLKPDGVEHINASGVKELDPYVPILDCWVYIDDERTPLGGRAAYNNLIAQSEGLIACNLAIQNAKPENLPGCHATNTCTRNYDIDLGFRLKVEFKDIVGGGKKTITLTNGSVYAN
jgi:hypothetical protein